MVWQDCNILFLSSTSVFLSWDNPAWGSARGVGYMHKTTYQQKRDFPKWGFCWVGMIQGAYGQISLFQFVAHLGTIYLFIVVTMRESMGEQELRKEVENSNYSICLVASNSR